MVEIINPSADGLPLAETTVVGNALFLLASNAGERGGLRPRILTYISTSCAVLI
jgi:hypothetical protein